MTRYMGLALLHTDALHAEIAPRACKRLVNDLAVQGLERDHDIAAFGPRHDDPACNWASAVAASVNQTTASPTVLRKFIYFSGDRIQTYCIPRWGRGG